MSKSVKIKKGLNINLIGKAEKILQKAEVSEQYAIKPPDFTGLTPKLAVKADHTVKAGSPLFFDKYRPEVKFTSPVSGTVVAVNRGERRRILEVVVKAEETNQYEQFDVKNWASFDAARIKEILLQSGLWPFIRQRPYAIIANPEDTPKSIFVPAFDTAPLAPDYDFIVQEDAVAFKTGLEVLSKLTEGGVNLTLHNDLTFSDTFKNAEGVNKHYFTGPHPAGAVGVQIHHISPLNKGDVVWYVNALNTILIGRLFEKGIYDASRIVALTGSEVKEPRYLRTMIGASIDSIVSNRLKETNNDLRFISGNVLTGTRVNKASYLGYYDSHLTVIPEGNKHEFLGWLMPGLNKMSMSRTFFSWLRPGKSYRLDTNYHGGPRAFIMTGEYEKVLPMDILPVQLLKSILVGDVERMEQLGIYEVAEEDMALCEFVCTSKMEVQSILRDGINTMIKEMG